MLTSRNIRWYILREFTLVALASSWAVLGPLLRISAIPSLATTIRAYSFLYPEIISSSADDELSPSGWALSVYKPMWFSGKCDSFNLAEFYFWYTYPSPLSPLTPLKWFSGKCDSFNLAEFYFWYPSPITHHPSHPSPLSPFKGIIQNNFLTPQGDGLFRIITEWSRCTTNFFTTQNFVV